MNLTFLKKVGKTLLPIGEELAPIAATAFLGPAVGAMTNNAIQLIVAHSKTGATGPEKKAAVMNALETMAPQVQAVLEATGSKVQDPTKFADGADKFVEALLDMLKATGHVTSNPSPIPEVTTSTVVVQPLDVASYQLSPTSVVMTKNLDKPVTIYVAAIDK